MIWNEQINIGLTRMGCFAISRARKSSANSERFWMKMKRGVGPDNAQNCLRSGRNHRPSSSSDTGSDFEAHLENLAKTLADSAEASRLNPGTLALGLWGCALLKLDLDEDVLDVLARDAIRQTEALRPNAFAKCIWALSTLAYDPTQEDLAKLIQKAQATILSRRWKTSQSTR